MNLTCLCAREIVNVDSKVQEAALRYAEASAEAVVAFGYAIFTCDSCGAPWAALYRPEKTRIEPLTAALRVLIETNGAVSVGS